MSKFTPPTFEEATIYGSELGLPEVECEKFWFYHDSRSWTVGRVKMSRWKSAMALWLRNFKSNQFNTAARENKLTGADVVIKGREYERVLEAIKSIQNSYESHRDILPDDKAKLSKLKQRRDTLRAQLGIEV